MDNRRAIIPTPETPSDQGFTTNQSPHVHRYEPKGTGQLSRWAECGCREKLAGENGPIVGSLAKIMRAIEEAKC